MAPTPLRTRCLQVLQVTVLAGVLVVTGGCDAEEDLLGHRARPTASNESDIDLFTLPAGSPSEGGMTGSIEGLLHVDPGTGCTWLQDTYGRPGRVVLVWPDGYRAQREPLQVLDPDDEVVAADGERVTLGGGFAQERSLPQCPVATPLWEVSASGA